MTLRRITAVLVLAMALWSFLYGWRQRRWSAYEYEMQNPADDPPDAYEDTEFAFARLRYRSIGRRYRAVAGAPDSNKAERQFIQGIRRLTGIHAQSVEEIIDVDSDELFNWPWLYAVEAGYWDLSESQAKRLREYLDRGGFLVVDDFHGGWEWETFMTSLRRIFPDRPVVELPDDDPIFHVLYNLDKRFQVPGRQYIWSGLTYERSDGVQPHGGASTTTRAACRWPSCSTWTMETPGSGRTIRDIWSRSRRSPTALASTTTTSSTR